MGSLLVSNIGHNNTEMNRDMDTRVLMGSEEDDANMFDTNKQNDLFLED